MSAKMKGYAVSVFIALAVIYVVERDLIPGIHKIVKGTD